MCSKCDADPTLWLEEEDVLVYSMDMHLKMSRITIGYLNTIHLTRLCPHIKDQTWVPGM
jgi:hypothetical protein